MICNNIYLAKVRVGNKRFSGTFLPTFSFLFHSSLLDNYFACFPGSENWRRRTGYPEFS